MPQLSPLNWILLLFIFWFGFWCLLIIITWRKDFSFIVNISKKPVSLSSWFW